MAPRTIRWGILATGGIAKAFAKDLSIDPATRGVTNIKHEVVAAASSSSASRAQDFLKEVLAPSSAKGYGSYTELVNDSNVDIIYVATPHSHHYQNAMLCLEAGKNVICEKALTVNAKQAKALVDKAKEKGLFFMEAVWTRYFPLSIFIRETITSGRLGNVTRVIADLSNPGDFENDHRMVNPDLAGGSLLDLGIYALTWCFQTLYHTQPAASRKRPTITSMMRKYSKTGVDESTAIILNFPRASGGDAIAVATSSFKESTDPDRKGTAGPAVRIYGEKGDIEVYYPTFRPQRTKIVFRDGTVEEKVWDFPGPGKGSGFFNGFGATMNPEGEGHGMYWEADECGFALVEGRKEGRYLGWDESILIMETMDEVRQQNGLVYPEKIETTKYPVEL